MKKTIRIYRRHDLDLFSLGAVKKYHLGKEMKKALIAYANQKPYTPPDIMVPEDGETLRTSMMLHITLDEKKAEEIQKDADFNYSFYKLSNICNSEKQNCDCCPVKKYCNSFIKAVFRNYLQEIPLSIYSTDSKVNLKRVSDYDNANNVQKIIAKTTVDNFKTAEDNAPTITQDDDKEIKNDEKMPWDDDFDIEENESSENIESLFAQMDAFTH